MLLLLHIFLVSQAFAFHIGNKNPNGPKVTNKTHDVLPPIPSHIRLENINYPGDRNSHVISQKTPIKKRDHTTQIEHPKNHLSNPKKQYENRNLDDIVRPKKPSKKKSIGHDDKQLRALQKFTKMINEAMLRLGLQLVSIKKPEKSGKGKKKHDSDSDSSSDSDSDSNSDSESDSNSDSDSGANSNSDSDSNSDSESDSKSISDSDSKSNEESESNSDSDSDSKSISESDSNSDEELMSNSDSDSDSDSNSDSDSDSNSNEDDLRNLNKQIPPRQDHEFNNPDADSSDSHFNGFSKLKKIKGPIEESDSDSDSAEMRTYPMSNYKEPSTVKESAEPPERHVASSQTLPVSQKYGTINKHDREFEEVYDFDTYDEITAGSRNYNDDIYQKLNSPHNRHKAPKYEDRYGRESYVLGGKSRHSMNYDFDDDDPYLIYRKKRTSKYYK